MKAILLSRIGDPSVLEYVEVPTPRPRPGEVLVKADTIGVSRPELLVVTKMDVTGAAEAADRIGAELCRDSLRISAVTGQGIPPLVHRIAALLDDLPPTSSAEAAAAGATADRGLGVA